MTRGWTFLGSDFIIYSNMNMTDKDMLVKLCYDEKGQLMPKPSCRAAMINHLILEEMMDIDEAEDLAEKTLNEINLWADAQETEQKPTE